MAGVLGLIMGSFVNALVYRLHKKMPVMWDRSICTICGKQLKWWHNIPLISFIFLCGKCWFCKSKISWQYPLVELATGILFISAMKLAADRFDFGTNEFAVIVSYWLLVIIFLVIIFLYDLKHYLILDKVSVPAIIIFIVLDIVMFLFFGFSEYMLSKVVISVIIGGGWFLIQFVFSKGKWVGGGDIRLGILMGLILSWPNILTALFIAYVGGSLISLPLILLKKKGMKSQIPFGIFLVPATMIAMWWGNDLINWYLNLF